MDPEHFGMKLNNPIVLERKEDRMINATQSVKPMHESPCEQNQTGLLKCRPLGPHLSKFRTSNASKAPPAPDYVGEVSSP